MRTHPWMPLYTDDLIASTSDMSCEELGAYIRLLCHIWSRGPIPIDETVICRIAACKKSVWRRISARFDSCTRDDGTPGLSHRRLEAERMKRKVLADERAEAGRRGAAARWNGKANGKRMANRCHATTTTTNRESNVVSTTRAREDAPAPEGAGLPRLAVDETDDATERNRAFIRQARSRRA